MKYNIELIRLIAVILITFTHTRHNLQEGTIYYIIEELPKFGTSILSIISGFLYWKISKDKDNLFLTKVKSLLIPFMIANLLVIIPVLLFNYFFDYNFLNRLSFDYKLFTEGVLSMNSPPINPPTYFIRDIFMVFVVIELIIKKNMKMLLIIIPFLLLGKLFLRIDIVALFILGILTAQYKDKVKKFIPITIALILLIFLILYYPNYIKFPISFLLFIILIDFEINFFKTGGYTYLLHLYHCPIMILAFPLLNMYIKNPILNIMSQISLSIILAYILFLITRKLTFLKIISGGR